MRTLSEILNDRNAICRLADVQRLSADRDFDAAARAAIALLDEQPSFAPALVSVAIDMMLGSGEGENFTIENTEKALERARELSLMAQDACFEYAHFLYSANDDAEAALEVTRAEITRLRERLQEILKLQADCLLELGREPEAKQALSRARYFGESEL